MTHAVHGSQSKLAGVPKWLKDGGGANGAQWDDLTATDGAQCFQRGWATVTWLKILAVVLETDNQGYFERIFSINYFKNFIRNQCCSC